MTDINEMVAEMIAETEIYISTSWSMYLSTGAKNFVEDTKRYKRQLSVFLAIQDVLAIEFDYAGDTDYVRQAITNRLGGME